MNIEREESAAVIAHLAKLRAWPGAKLKPDPEFDAEFRRRRQLARKGQSRATYGSITAQLRRMKPGESIEVPNWTAAKSFSSAARQIGLRASIHKVRRGEEKTIVTLQPSQ